MSGLDRKEEEIRRMLDLRHPPLPPGLAARAAGRGRRALRRRRALRAVGWVLLVAGVVAFSVWAALTEPWSARPWWESP
ncbi:hypothetical protein [Streptomyces albireticuli]|uniref:DUF3040 domain-containing protein n=1 Tax=Streptomyces albireticuli TaxID=1940 RepID=A0A2A2CVQ3_9ACTN|nr:hypothetical protein [Streptomyces albireticuli]MCD9142699.1 hypothetical protein [Streptomyces albireticuli]MCD9162982.1 hypothetical protein [Streptomyces albireticuli]MCD9192827.1 hypothetical protein [Streptomyces albireticuli]PAU44288.1 hypothetical protein CK936_35885 [Streptomyces albireticuli]